MGKILFSLIRSPHPFPSLRFLYVTLSMEEKWFVVNLTFFRETFFLLTKSFLSGAWSLNGTAPATRWRRRPRLATDRTSQLWSTFLKTIIIFLLLDRCARDFLNAVVPSLREGQHVSSKEEYHLYQRLWQNGSVHVRAISFCEKPSNFQNQCVSRTSALPFATRHGVHSTVESLVMQFPTKIFYVRWSTRWTLPPPSTGNSTLVMLRKSHASKFNLFLFGPLHTCPEPNITDVVVAFYFSSDHKTVLNDYLVYDFGSMVGEVWNVIFWRTCCIVSKLCTISPQVGGLLGMFLGVSLLNFFDAGNNAYDLLRTKIRKKKEETILAVDNWDGTFWHSWHMECSKIED